MATLKIKKKTSKIWVHEPSDINIFILSKFYIKSDGDYIQIVEQGGVQRAKYIFSDVEVYDIGGIAETFTSVELLMKRLEALNYTGFFYDGEVIPATLISSDLNNGIVLGSDGKLYSSAASQDTFTLSFPRLAITGNATNVFFASFINTSSVLFNSSTAISNHLSLNTINFSTTRLFVVPQDCIIDKITINLNVNFELSIWKADSLVSPTTGKTEVFYGVSSGLGIANYNVNSPTLTQGNILVPMIKTLGGTSTYFGDFFITFKTI